MIEFTPSPEQQAIMDFPLAPLRVAAGAGTGKTTTMALRLAALIEQHDIEPEQALGITFTNKAAEELADRLRRHLHGLAAEGREVQVATYHGFAYQVLREFGAAIGVERDAAIVTPGYTRQMLREALGSLDPDELDLTDPGRRVDEVAALADRLGDHLRTPEDIVAAAPASGEDAVWGARSELAEAITRYQAVKQRLGVLDYGDLIGLGFRLLDGHPELAARIRQRYRVVLLDEYQDTNPAQREFLRRLFGDGFPVTAVGDPDQTIYEWRGASLENFAGFPDHFPGPDGAPAATLTLSLNRRCDRAIIDLANAVKARIDGPAGIAALQGHDDAGPGMVQRSWLADDTAEAAWIAEEVRRLHDEEDLAWRDMAVLFRKNALIPAVRQALETAGVPVEVAALGGLLDIPEVSDLHAWLRLIGRPDDSPALVRILLGSFYRLGLGDLAPLAAWVRLRQKGEDEEFAPGWAMLEAVDRLEEVPGLRPEARDRLMHFRELYRGFLADAQGISLIELSRRILDGTGAWAEVESLDDAARLSTRLNLYRFLDLTETWSPLEGRPSLDAFLEYLDLLRTDDISQELDTARLSGEDAVSLLTIHRAKGLEWPVVFLPGAVKGTFPSGMRKAEDPLRFPEVLPFEMRLDNAALPVLGEDDKANKALLRGMHDSQEWRTAYVAVTRAKHRLFVTGAFRYSPKQIKDPSAVFDLVAGLPGATAGHIEPEPRPWEGPGDGEDAPAPDPDFLGGWPEAMRTALDDPLWPERAAPDPEGFATTRRELTAVLDGLPRPPEPEADTAGLVVSVTDLVTLAGCPRRYFWSAIDPLPRRPGPARRYGSDVHRVIELHNTGVIPADEASAVSYDLPPGEGDHPGSGAGDAVRVFRDSRFAAIRPALTEAPFALRLGTARIRGRIDAIYRHDPDRWEIVDFKSGRPSDDPARRVQLQAYAVAAVDARLVPAGDPNLEVTFAFLGGGTLHTVTESVDAAWLSEARARLIDLSTLAATGPHFPAPALTCRGCDFLRFCAAGREFLAAE